MNFNKKQIKLITNNEEQTYELIKKNLKECKSFKFNVAFITYGGYQILAQTFDELNKKNIKGQILTTSYQDFTDPKVMKSFEKFENFEMKVVDSLTINKEKINDSFHPKGYIFEYDNYYNVLIGSVNMTEKAMKTNVEWSLLVRLEKHDVILQNILDEFEFLWSHTKPITDEFINLYTRKFESKKLLIQELKKVKQQTNKVKPNSIQIQALETLTKLRNNNQSKALIIAATGVGKTYLSAFDVKQFNPNKFLFVVHREEILNSAKKTYESIIENKATSIFKGNKKETNANMIFASQQTLYRNLDLFKPDEFDYIVIDEAHHAAADTYLKIINYFKPKFLLGMTATPERMDGENIFSLFENNIAIEVRLKDAINQDLITSFHYFGISDLNSIDLTNLDVENQKDLDKIAKELMVNERVDFIIEKMNLYQFDGPKMNCLGFCVNIEHAKYMAEEFNKRGIVARYLVGSTPSNERKEIIDRFQDDQDPLEVIFVVDIFNEGVDIPKVNLVLFLRPTNSPIIFLQQLGRGLRKYNNKTFLTVLDFIANHSKTYLVPYAIASFNNVVNEFQVQDMIKSNFKTLSEFHIEFDAISQQRILNSFSNINIYSEKWIKNEYLKFKSILNRIPKYMCDYLIEGAPDVLKICHRYKNYLSFLSRIENDSQIFDLLKNKKFEFYINYLTKLLPIYRINEFILILESIKNECQEISFEQAKEIINIYTPNTSNWSIEHTFKFLNGEFYEKEESYKYRVFELKNNKLELSNDFKEIIEDKNYFEFIIDILDYGIRYFLNNYNLNEYVFPFIKIGQRYKRDDILFINTTSRNRDTFFATEGVFCFKENPDHYYLTINFQEDNMYDNRVLSRDLILWYSPNAWSQDGKRALKIINQKNENIKIHIFIRKYKQINNVTQPYIYMGKASVASYKGNKPIEFKLKLENPLSDDLYYELIKK